MSYGVVRTDKLAGTDVRSLLVSIQYMKGGSTPTAIENGNILKVGDLKAGEREIYVGGDVAANDKLSDVVLVASVEMDYEDNKAPLDEYINEAGKICRGYHLHSGDIFSVTKEALAGAEAPAVGDIVELAAGTKLNVKTKSEGATESSTVVGKIIAKEIAGKNTFFVIEVD